jgi:hypothetical protein
MYISIGRLLEDPSSVAQPDGPPLDSYRIDYVFKNVFTYINMDTNRYIYVYIYTYKYIFIRLCIHLRICK